MRLGSSAALRIAIVGHSFMGAAHTRGWRDVNDVYQLPVRCERVLLCGRDAERAAVAARRLGWQESTGDWRIAVERDDIDVVDICTPVASHAEIAVAALQAGKHVICEKPLALDAAQAQRMASAAAAAAPAGTLSMCAFNYRRVPAVALLRELVGEGRLGEIRQLRASYLQDWGAIDPSMSWRFDAAEAGFGALGDLGSHIVDLAEFICGSRVESVSSAAATFIKQRADPQVGMHTVDVDDAVVFVGQLDNQALASFDASRVARGAKNGLVVDVFGERGSLRFDLQRLNEICYFDGADDPRTAGYRTVLVTEATHPYLDAWWPPGHVLGWEHTFTHELHDFVAAICTGKPITPDFAQASHVQNVLEAVARSWSSRRWENVLS